MMIHLRCLPGLCLVLLACDERTLAESDVPTGIYQIREEIVENTCSEDEALQLELTTVYRYENKLSVGLPFRSYSTAARVELTRNEDGSFAADYEHPEGATKGSVMALITAHERAFQVMRREEHSSDLTWLFEAQDVSFPCVFETVTDFELVELCEDPCSIRYLNGSYVCDCSEA